MKEFVSFIFYFFIFLLNCSIFKKKIVRFFIFYFSFLFEVGGVQIWGEKKMDGKNWEKKNKKMLKNEEKNKIKKEDNKKKWIKLKKKIGTINERRPIVYVAFSHFGFWELTNDWKLANIWLGLTLHQRRRAILCGTPLERHITKERAKLRSISINKQWKLIVMEIALTFWIRIVSFECEALWLGVLKNYVGSWHARNEERVATKNTSNNEKEKKNTTITYGSHQTCEWRSIAICERPITSIIQGQKSHYVVALKQCGKILTDKSQTMWTLVLLDTKASLQEERKRRKVKRYQHGDFRNGDNDRTYEEVETMKKIVLKLLKNKANRY
ncbi:hypothetical protein RFI_28669 [Reticulomyxa filosa]|uniref:Uncharacterized protein n=1 Tax=Reticulomyxa filosa TaxID=46433 RepID=X6M408_RETFI|nr:hypothetical protein RFI_28669 [Reticulomyxa filosa]|eukprot:ETO08718.1 hypothetical protein RFI_28669 [Reticulomyxa filosa]